MKCICKVCGKEFDRKPALIKRAKNPTCSEECRNKMYRHEATTKCCVCGKEIKTTECELKKRPQKVCSKECKSKLISNLKKKDKVELQCPMCKKYFEVHSYRLNNQVVICCSRSCATKYQERDKTKHPRYNENISDEERIDRRILKENVLWRNEVMKRDKYTCQVCKQYGGKLEAHHLNSYHWDKEHRLDLNNGITLCQRCHKDFHKKYTKHNNTKEQFIEYVNQSGS